MSRRRNYQLTEKEKASLTEQVVKAIRLQDEAKNITSKKTEVVEIDSPQWGKLEPVTARIRTRADLAREYVISRINALPNFLQTLPTAFDDLTCDFGLDAYRRMLQDNEVAAAFGVIKLAVTAQNASITPCVQPGDKNYEKAKAYAEFFSRQLRKLTKPFNETLEELLDALAEGSAVAEVMTDLIEHGDDEGLIGITGISKKPLEHTRFLVDGFGGVAGIVPLRIGQYIPNRNIIPLDPSGKIVDADWVLRREKFIIFTYEPPSNDPRGRSLLRSAYAAWFAKECVIKNWLEFVALAGNPILTATASPEAGDVCFKDPLTGEEVKYKATEYLQMVLEEAKSGARLSLPNGARVEFVGTPNVGTAFEKFIAWCDKAILRAILNQHLATGEGEHQARAAADVHKDTLGLNIIRIKNRLSDRIREDLFKPVMRRNWGEDSVELAPVLDLGDGDGFPPKLEEIMKLVQVAPSDAIDWNLLREKYKLPIVEDYQDIANEKSKQEPPKALNHSLGQENDLEVLPSVPVDKTMQKDKDTEGK